MEQMSPILLFREESQSENLPTTAETALVESKISTILVSTENCYQTLITKTREAADASEHSDC